MYSIIFIVLLSFFAHNVFEAVVYDVWHVNKTFSVGNITWYVRDFFLFFDAPTVGYYGEVPALDIQVYTQKLGLKIICFVLALGCYWLLQTLNLFLAEIPGRTFTKMPYILLTLCLLFGYEVLDYILFAGQTDWHYQSIIVMAAISYVILFVKK